MTDESKSSLPPAARSPGSPAVKPERVREIAIEVERLCGAIRSSRSAITFNDEPSQYRIMLERKAR